MSRPDADRFVAAALAIVAAAWCVTRFAALDEVPHGYWMDETLGAIHVRCLAETGHADGRPWPLFPRAHGGGGFGPTWIYVALAWTRVFGDSVAGLRALSALASVLTVAGLAAIAYRLGGRRWALTTAVAAALSPWSFQFSRIAWDPPFGPLFLVWGTFFLLLRPRAPTLALAGLTTALALYSYSPTRLQAGLWLPLLVAVQWRRGAIGRRGALVVLGAFAAALLPLAVLVLEGGTMNARLRELTLFSPAWREWTRELRGRTPEPLFLLFTFLDNVAAHLRPSFLVLWGDANLRHSTGASGVLGAVDVLALALAAGVALSRLARGACAPGRSVVRTAGLLAAGAALGIAPAALCWEGVPHALRSIGAWPFVALLSGLVLARLWERRPWVGAVLLAVAVAFTAQFLSGYFGPYRRIDARWFHPDLAAAAARAPKDGLPDALRPFVRRAGYEREEIQFLLMDRGGLGCDTAEQAARVMWP